MSKSSNFFGQPIYGQLIKSLDREKIVEMSRKHGGEKYVKSFDGYTHLLTMLYAVIQRFDSLREIETSMTAEVRKLHHVGIHLPLSLAEQHTPHGNIQKRPGQSHRILIILDLDLHHRPPVLRILVSDMLDPPLSASSFYSFHSPLCAVEFLVEAKFSHRETITNIYSFYINSECKEIFFKYI